MSASILSPGGALALLFGLLGAFILHPILDSLAGNIAFAEFSLGFVPEFSKIVINAFGNNPKHFGMNFGMYGTPLILASMIVFKRVTDESR